MLQLVKVDPGFRDPTLEELPHIRQQLLAANEQNASLRQNAALFAGQLGQQEAAVSLSIIRNQCCVSLSIGRLSLLGNCHYYCVKC